jgi:hypothetical protein
VTGTDIKKSTWTIDIFYVSSNEYLFVNKGKLFDAQGSWGIATGRFLVLFWYMPIT